MPLPSSPRRSLVWLAVLAVVAGGVLLRLWDLEQRSLWFDEAFCWRLTQFSFVELLDRVGRDNHPPLYFIVLQVWCLVFGSSVVALRALSVLFGALTILGTYLFAVEAFDHWDVRDSNSPSRARARGIGLVAAGLVALSPFQIRYSQEVRMYALATALTLLSTWALLRALRQPSTPRRWVLYGVLALLLVYTHYYALFTLAAQAIFFAAYLLVSDHWNLRAVVRRRVFWQGVLTACLVVLAWLPWLPSFLHQRKQVQADFWTGAVNRWDMVDLAYRLFVLPERTDFAPSRSEQLLVADIVVLGLWLLRRKARVGEWSVLCAVLTPLLLALLVSAYDTRVIGATRFFLMIHPFFLVGLAALLWRLPLWERSVTVAGALAAAILLYAQYWDTTDAAHKPGSRAAAEFINSRREPEEPVVVCSALYYFPQLYYGNRRETVYLYTDPRGVVHYHGSAALTPQDMITSEQLRTLAGARVWVVDMTGGYWGEHRVPVPLGWVDKGKQAFTEVFGLGQVVVVEYETGGH